MQKRTKLNMEEMLDVYNLKGEFVGVKSKSFCHGKNPGVYYKPIWIWIINSKGQLLLQRRAKTKKQFPGVWDHSVGGHVKSGEKSVDACVRELKEELGLQIKKEKLNYIGEFLEQIYWHIGQVYFLFDDLDIANIKFDKRETEEIKWFELEEFKKVLFSDEFGPFQEDYKKWVFDKIKQVILSKK